MVHFCFKCLINYYFCESDRICTYTAQVQPFYRRLRLTISGALSNTFWVKHGNRTHITASTKPHAYLCTSFTILCANTDSNCNPLFGRQACLPLHYSRKYLVDKNGVEPLRPRLQRGALPLELLVLIIKAGEEWIEHSTYGLTGRHSSTELFSLSVETNGLEPLTCTL